MDQGHLAQVDPRHLVFSIWATTQHYADFAVQVEMLLPPGDDGQASADAYLTTLFSRLLTP
jgi:TetR/AcrR family transcriptional regulator